MKKANESAEAILKMMSFQYEPVEKQLFKWCEQHNRPEIIRKYRKADAITKLAILDKTAQEMGL